jgi:phospholipid-binding lipoprotein MlaA
MRKAGEGGKLNRLVGGLLVVLVCAPVTSVAEQDPWQGLNRNIFEFNEWTDRHILRPTAVAYTNYIPGFVRSGVGNVFDNVATPVISLNQLLQGKPKASASDFGRFLINTTLGLGGLFDIASKTGLAKHQEDFGQTFGVWGAGTGHYIVLPFLGPSNVRDSFGLAVNSVLNPIRLISPVEDRALVTALYVVDVRADLIGVDELVMGDRYLFRRDTYLQSRAFQINDGVGDEDPFADDGFDDFDDE